MSYALTRAEAIQDERMSDDTIRHEFKAMSLVSEARRLLIEASNYTSLMRGQIHDGLDTLPNISEWETELNDARNT